jgi:hypothetical protein
MNFSSSLFVTDNGFQTDETSLYADQFMDRNTVNLKWTSRFQNWVATKMAEMKVLLGLIIAIKLVVQLEVSECWTTSEVNTMPVIPLVMSVERDFGFW